MPRQTLLAAGAVVLTLCARGAVQASIIDDKSDFVGDFTVIDFETTATGESFGLDPGDFARVEEGGYSQLGVVFSAPTTDFGPWIADSTPNPQFDAAHVNVGSPPNFLAIDLLFGPPAGGFLHFSFDNPVNAVAASVVNRSDGGPVRMEVYDSLGQLIESVDFRDSMIDGMILGSEFGNPYDREYGFIGVFSPDVPIAYGLLYEDLTQIDDFHFGVIPEPGTILLLLGGIAGVSVFRRRTSISCNAITMAVSVLLVVAIGAPAQANETVSGRVTGWVDLTNGPICGESGYSQCVDPILSQVDLEGLLVCASGEIFGGECAYTGSDGTYETVYYGFDTDDVTVTVEILGQWAEVGPFDFIAEPVFVVPDRWSRS